jgi:hypothetical protein
VRLLLLLAVLLLSCRDISAVKDGKVESFVCMGYEQGARVTCLAFQSAGSLLVSGATQGNSLPQQRRLRCVRCSSCEWAVDCSSRLMRTTAW